MSERDHERHEPYSVVGVVLGWLVAIGALTLMVYVIKRRFYL